MLENTALIGENGVNGDQKEDVQKNAEEVLKQEIVTALVNILPTGVDPMKIENARTTIIHFMLQSRIKIHFVTKTNPHKRVGNVIKNLAEMQDGQWVMDKGKAACLITSM